MGISNVQKALLLKNFWYKWKNVSYTVLGLLLPPAMITFMSVLTLIASSHENLRELNHGDTKYDFCPSFLGQFHLETILPLDDRDSLTDWTTSGYPCTDKKCYPKLEYDFTAENYPDGVVAELCTEEIAKYLDLLPKKVSSVQLLNYWLSLLENGDETEDIKVTYTMNGYKEETGPKTPPTFIQWLEEFANDNIANIIETQIASNVYTHYDNNDANWKKISIDDLFSAQQALQALVFTHEQECDESNFIDYDEKNWDEKGPCYHWQDVPPLSSSSTVETPLVIKDNFEWLSGPGLLRTISINYKTPEAGVTGQRRKDGFYYKSEVLNMYYDGLEDITFRPMMTYQSYLVANAWTGGLINSPFRHQMQTSYTDHNSNAWYQPSQVIGDKFGYMDLYPIVNLFYNDLRIASNQNNNSNLFYSGQLSSVQSVPETILIEVLTKWFIKHVRFVSENATQAEYQPWYAAAGPSQKSYQQPWTERELQTFKRGNSLVIAPICYAVNSYDDNIRYRGELVKNLFPLLADPLRYNTLEFTVQLNVLFDKFQMQTGAEIKGRDEKVKYIENMFQRKREYWIPLLQKKYESRENQNFQTFGDYWQAFLAGERLNQAISFGYFWLFSADAWSEFWNPVASSVTNQEGYVQLSDETVAKVLCDPQRMSDLQKLMVGAWPDIDIKSILLLQRMLVDMDQDLPPMSDLTIPSYSWEVDTNIIAVKETAFPFPHAAFNVLPKMVYETILPYLIILIGVLPLMANYMRLFIDDRQRFMFQYLSIMGISPVQYWLSYYALASIEITLISLLQATVMNILLGGNFFLLWIGFWFADFQLVVMGLIISSFFRSSSSAVLTACFVALIFVQFWLLAYVLGSEIGGATNYFMILAFPTFGACWFQYFVQLGAMWTTCDPGSETCNLTGFDMRAANGIQVNGIYFGGTIGASIASCVLYILLAHYFLLAFPRDGSAALKWYFPVSAEFWKSTFNLKQQPEQTAENTSSSSSDDGNNHGSVVSEAAPDVNKYVFGPEKTKTSKVLSVNGATKRFKQSKKVRQERGKYFYAVNDISFDVYDGECMVLLGHNGAGKTTLMNLLTGQHALNAGQISVAGHDVSYDRTMARKFIGFCPQFDVQWDYMTTRDHFHFAAVVKGEEDVEKAVEEAAELLELTDKLDFRVCELSGGQRRRVSIGMAVIGGDTKLLILDEPSTGIDPATRRSLWSSIRRLQVNRGVLITTHFMDECDYLADRTAVMAHGRLKALGTPHELKTAMNCGYNLTITKSSTGVFDREKVEEILQIIPSYKLRNDIALEIVYTVPMSHANNLRDVLERLHHDAEQLGVSNYTVGVTSIEDVFLELGSHGESEVSDVKDFGYDIFAKYAEFIETGFWNSVKNQSIALFFKRWTHFSSSVREILIGLLGGGIYFAVIGAAMAALISMGEPVALSTSDSQFYDSIKTLKIEGNQRYLIAANSDINLPDNTIYDKLIDCMKEKGYDGRLIDPNKENLHDLLLDDMSTAWHNNRFHIPYVFAVQINNFEFANNYKLINDLADRSPGFDFELYHNSAVYTWNFGFAYTSFTQCSYSIHNPKYQLEQIRMEPSLRKAGGASITVSLQESILGAFFAMAVLFGISTWSISVIEERNSNSKHLQMISGIRMWLYWFVQMTFDYFVFFASIWIAILVQYLVGGNLTDDRDTLGAAIIAMLLYPLSDIPRAYFMSNFVNSPAVAIMISILYTQVPAVAAVFLPTVLFEKNAIPEIDLALSILLPPYHLSSQLAVITSLQAQCPYNRNDNPDEFFTYCKDQLDMTATRGGIFESYHPFGWYLWTWCCSTVIWWTIFLITEFLWTHPYIYKRFKLFFRKSDDSENYIMDDALVDEVQDEANLVAAKEGTVEENELLVLDKLRKVFPAKKRLIGNDSPGKVAVESLSLIIPDGQCFGFLGVNGAGKSTTVNMLTSVMAPSSGIAKFAGHNIETAGGKLYEMVSYCPQFNGLLEYLSARQILWFYATAAGIKMDKIEEFVNELVLSLGIEEYADRQCGSYSGGNKRKLSVAIAFIGRPKVVFLDEPSSGVDPASRRKLWNIIVNTTRYGNRCVILTTHSMDECEALCDRLTIMKSGRMMCLGTPSEVKSAVGRGYMVELYLDSSAYDETEQSWSSGVSQLFKAFQAVFHTSSITEVNSNRIRLSISKDESTVYSLFSFLYSQSSDLKFKNYTVSDCTLEAVFVAINQDDNPVEYNADDGDSNSSSTMTLSYSPISSIESDNSDLSNTSASDSSIYKNE